MRPPGDWPARTTYAAGALPDLRYEGRSRQMNVTIIRGLLAVALSAMLMLGLAATASAHEHREVGDYELTVGFTGEPALVNEPNGLDLRVQKGHGDDGTPVEGLQETLKAEISFAGETKELELRARFGQPGAYTADIFPTAEGAYTFHIFGTIEGTDVDETVTSGPETFAEVESTDAIAFPSTTGADSGANAVSDAQDSADSAQTLATAAIIVGVLGLIAGLGGAIMAMNARKTNRTAGTVTPETGD
ncbi:MAG TPA: hypothetical protein VFV93_10410 [Thermomicrobiales bacterium]|nr:hypothetical protein [Thermomicrobiales bacterium]